MFEPLFQILNHFFILSERVPNTFFVDVLCDRIVIVKGKKVNLKCSKPRYFHWFIKFKNGYNSQFQIVLSCKANGKYLEQSLKGFSIIFCQFCGSNHVSDALGLNSTPNLNGFNDNFCEKSRTERSYFWYQAGTSTSLLKRVKNWLRTLFSHFFTVHQKNW